MRKLDRLTQDEAWMTVAQTLGVVHGLLDNMQVVMEGTGVFAQYNADIFLSTRSMR